MNYLQVDRLSKSFGERVLFENISFGLQQGQKTALVARNGAGKTTLLRILAGAEQPDSGEVVFRNGIQVVSLAQEPPFKPESTILESIFETEDPRMLAISRYERLLEQGDAVPDSELQDAIRKVEEAKAWDIHSKVQEVLGRLNIHDLERTMGSLSGGQRKRVSLAAVLLQEPDLLLLDEPTNHLDVEMIEWLEAYLRQSNITLLMVTHDRYFLDNVCSDILEIDRQSVSRYKGSYANYLERKAENIAAFNSEVEKARNLYTRELEWMRRMPKARGTKAKSRIDSFYEVKDKASQRLQDDQVKLSVKMNRLGGKILELVKVSKSFGNREIIKPFTYTFKGGEKIGIAGKNGSGKSTFLKMIMGEIPTDTGKIQVGDTVVFGYYSQDGMILREDRRVIDVVKDIADYIPLADGSHLPAAQFLQRFLFSPPMQHTFVSKLSGGEKRRLYLLTVLMKNPNFLILDEPTNDLDIQTLNVLQDFLEDFQGCVLLVSHDRYFMDTLADHMFIFDGSGEIRDFNGNYTAYRNEMSEKKVTAKESPVPKEREKKERAKPSFKEVHEYNQLEKEIPELEQKIELLTGEMNSGISDHNKIRELAEKVAELSAELEVKTDRWLLLAEKIN